MTGASVIERPVGLSVRGAPPRCADGLLSEEQRQELLRIADCCAVHRTLTSKIDIQTSLVAPSSAPM
jgi:hypothetical protein